MEIDSIFQSMQQGILICSSQSRILYFNDAYGEYIGHTLQEVKGKKITKFRKYAMVPEVIASGKPVEGMIRREGSQEYFCSVYPIRENGLIRGTVSIVTTMASHQLKVNPSQTTLRERVRNFERQEILAELALYGEDTEGKKKAAEKLGISVASLYNKLQM